MGKTSVTIKLKSKKQLKNEKISKSLKPAQKAEVKKLIAGNERVQYCATQQLTLTNLKNRLISKTLIGTPSTEHLNMAMPITTTGLGISNRVSTKIQMIKGSTDFFFSFKEGYTKSNIINVFIYLLNSKEAKSGDNSLTNNLIGNNLLMKGDNTTVDWIPSANNTLELAEMKINNMAFKGRVHKFTLARCSGGTNNDASTPPPSSNSTYYPNQHHFTWHWGAHKNLKYEPVAADTGRYPTNFAPMWGCVAYYPDGTAVGDDGSDLPVVVSVRNHLFFHNV